MHRITSASRFPLSQCEMLFLHMYSLQFSKKISMMIIFFPLCKCFIIIIHVFNRVSQCVKKKKIMRKKPKLNVIFIFPNFFFGRLKKKKKFFFLFLIAAENCITRCRWCELYSADETDRRLCAILCNRY